MTEYVTYELRNHLIYVCLVNGNQIMVPKYDLLTPKEIKRLFNKNNMGEKLPSPGEYKRALFRTVYISMHASSQCNMKCKYCFMQNRQGVNITIDEAKRFIDF